MRFVAILLLAVGCSSIRDYDREERASRGVRVTSNPDSVKACKFLVNVSDATAFGYDQNEMKRQVVRYGGDTLMLTSDRHVGEAYLCAMPQASGSQAR